jgi:hypothetical protein
MTPLFSQEKLVLIIHCREELVMLSETIYAKY